MPESSSPGLTGVRVLDFGHRIAGPLAALLLAEAGADVVHVDSPEAARAPGPADAYLNRSKRRITLDLKTAAGRATALDLAGRADVVIENFRPGVMDRLGLGAGVLRAADERLVYCSLPGFAPDDANAPLAAWEGILHAAVAGYRPLSQHWDPTGRARATVADREAPLFTPITTASNFGALMGAVSVVMALIARRRSGRGQTVRVPLAEAFCEAYSTMLGMRVYENGLMGDAHMLRDLTYRCADGGMIDLSPYAKFVVPLLAAAGVAEDWQAAGLIDIAERSFAPERRDEIMTSFAELVRGRSAAWWDRVATEAEVPVSRVRTPAEWMACPQATESGAAIALQDPAAGRILLPGRGFDLAGAIPPPRPRDLPGRDGGVLAPGPGGWLSPRSAPEPGGASGPPLEGVRAIDISQAVAGPTTARLLADFGAEVVKVGSTVPAVTDGIVGHLHRGKRTILLDGRSEAGERLTTDLVRSADVLVTNFTPKSQERYGIGHRRLQAVNRRLVHCSISAYGSAGPWAGRRGYENQCNAATGMSWRYGARFGWTLYQPTPINDAGTGVLGAFAVAVALYSRGDDGDGVRVGASLAQASTLHQGVHLAIEAQQATGPDTVRSEHGTSALDRLYRAEDGWFFLAARPDQSAALLSALSLPDGGGEQGPPDPAGPTALLLAGRFATGTARHWTDLLAGAGIAAHPVATIDEAVGYLDGRGLVYFEPGPGGRAVARPGIGARWLSETPPRAGADPGPIGSQAVEILAELGLSAAETAELAEADVVSLPGRLPKLTRLT
ncbi:CoA transferase [Actinocorallia longicatena]|uniref:CoA transferase n=1 Tax=Actinocorallia longicatena TaxID=111803 RepID=A0ABP6QJA4_9ACTN